MDRILLEVTKKKDRRRLEDWLSPIYHIVLPNHDRPFQDHVDLVIIDGPSLKKLRAKVRALRRSHEPVFLPFLLLTVRRRSSMPGRHLGRVVDDLLVRPLNEKELLARVANLLRMRRWSLELKKEHDRVMKLVVTDDVSGFNNTRYLHRKLDRLLDPGPGKVQPVSLAFFDLDNFKSLVDTHGHLCGTKTLREVGQAVARVLDEDDRLVRYGGDEFIVILPRQRKEEASAKVRRMKEAIESTHFLQREDINARLTASFGLASFPEDARDKGELLAEADRCLFKSKTEGKNRISLANLAEAA